MLPALFALLLATEGPILAPSADHELRFGIQAAQKGLWNEARFRFERAVTLEPENAKALNDLAVSLEHLGEFEKAREAYDKALKLKPGDGNILQNFDLFREADDKRTRKTRSKEKKKP